MHLAPLQFAPGDGFLNICDFMIQKACERLKQNPHYGVDDAVGVSQPYCKLFNFFNSK